MQVDIDILVYAVIAALLFGRLWAVFGTRNEGDPQRPNPFMPPPNLMPSNDAAKTSQNIMSRLEALAPPPTSLAGGLAQVKVLDPGFDEKQFVQESRDIFTSVVGAFASGRLSLVSEFLSPALLGSFQQAVDRRNAANQSAHTRIERIKEAEVVSARAEDKKALVTVRFVSEQENVMRGPGGSVVGGAEGKVEEITDTWTFARDTQLPAAKWIVVETRG